MKITGAMTPAAPAVAQRTETEAAAPAATAAAGAATSAQSAGLQQAQASLAGLPEVDQAKVAALRDALARGELPFDPAKLAALIDRYHGGKP
ncbi:MAG: flagellar biosynthesis anti-sigma factor FlgM [Candidatus Dactylopiibacterium carminicum]|uniref:Negative regulator of flagellin synthesis n=1 Tax=Candidatus Dactylopiibacterium carminicum TaxID=857335 RepID=A0A272EWH6_9RHOO|nr:flagellar biosynthesis anti-sigma factor FlgM [Candidatus Dactylopiibacterium carminicum]KAF7599960.1 flagellar biosynthesis anti-sigma factor FlgM [Candidatus Dactylopiibacterium carminicum]PAS94459.1 MAG: flagellar biosynthesis anti-sigma factor FlgM [Candidatus Dactylopiibacterium carminicum]PAS97056.1 MAG: flagellar biosynthesis anti-sigma factor FlgM [Candidatus Dactylopiibacterium carminicum]PAS99963.1 MAG: flagellar biosynthesis anti-sigma factor FlgM [Candidatus Dactylopiibacterium c